VQRDSSVNTGHRKTPVNASRLPLSRP
jgi:hypothetical protein